MPSDSAEQRHTVSAIIPCLDEEDAIGPCVAAVLAQGVGEVIVVDGQSGDRTAERAAAAGARIIVEPARGYGRAMLSGLAAVAPTTTIILFIDGDGSDRPEMIPAVLAPIEDGRADFVLASRLSGERDPGSLGASQIVAGHLAGLIIRLLYNVSFTDMSPFRAVRRDVLERLGMAETIFAWNLEMQMRVAAAGLHAWKFRSGSGVARVAFRRCQAIGAMASGPPGYSFAPSAASPGSCGGTVPRSRTGAKHRRAERLLGFLLGSCS